MPTPPSDHGAPPPRPAGRFVAVVAALGTVLLAAMLLGISLGTVTVPLGEIRRVFAAHLGLGDGEVSAVRDQIIWQYRTSRVLLAAVVGAALAVSGACLQVLARNGLADPYVLGVSSGASLGAVLAIAFGVTAVGGLGASGAAFVAAVLTLLIVFVLAQRAGRIGPSRLVLAGVATSYLASALTSLVQLYADPLALRGTMFWLLGSLQNARWDDLGLPAAAIVLCTAWLLVRARAMNVLAMGDEVAATLGVAVNRLRIELLVVASLLTATAVAVAGGIGFVGLMVPHAARLVVGPDHRRVLPVCALAGGGFLVLVDLASRMLDRPNELPVGVFTAAIGAPFFLVLLRRAGRHAGTG